MSHAFVFTSDWHLGLKTDGIDRRDEILDIAKTVIVKCAELEAVGHEVRLILGGDLFDDHDPSEDLIAFFIQILGLIHKAGIKTDVLIGNHEAVADPKRLSCLSFLREIKTGYPLITLRESIKTVQIVKGKLFVTFLPHITRATLASIGPDSKLITTQEYIDLMGEKAVNSIPEKAVHLAFSHLNVRQSVAGSEANLLKRSEAYLPLAFVNPPPGTSTPIIINGHIHSAQKIGNVRIVGSPLFCTFGESGDKGFCRILIDDDGVMIEDIRTPCVPFLQTHLDMISENKDFLTHPDLSKLIDEIGEYTRDARNVIAKIGVTISAENNSYDWVQMRKKFEDLCDAKHAGGSLRVLPIEPKVVQKRVTRNIKQKADLEPDAAIKVYLKANIKNDPDKMKRIYRKAKPYMGLT